MNGSLGSPFNFFGLTTLVVSRKPGSFHNRTYRPTLGANPCEEYLEKGMKQPVWRHVPTRPVDLWRLLPPYGIRAWPETGGGNRESFEERVDGLNFAAPDFECLEGHQGIAHAVRISG